MGEIGEAEEYDSDAISDDGHKNGPAAIDDASNGSWMYLITRFYDYKSSRTVRARQVF